MGYHALIIGIDDYAEERQKLTSAVKDALAFRAALLEHGLADVVELYTAPLVADSTGPADSRTLLRALDRYYRADEAVEKLIFYYAGHGISALSDAAGTRARTALVPVDVEDLQRDGRSLIDLDELRELFAQSGPLEQLFFIDACRNLDYERQPSVASLGLSGVRPGTARRQATLFAVSPLGKAEAVPGGHGVFTEQLLEGLRGKGRALDFDATLDAYVVTMQSLHEHARAVVLDRLKDETRWVQSIQPPQLIASSPGPGPLRTLDDVEPCALTVHITPDAAASATEVVLSLRRQALGPDYGYPRRLNHEQVLLQPQLYSVRASSRAGQADPAHATVDVRVVAEHTIRILPPVDARELALAAEVPDSGVLAADVLESHFVGFGEDDSDSGTVLAEALECHVTISLSQLESPYRRWTDVGALRESVPVGPYRVDFHLGASVFSSSEIYVAPAAEVRVAPKLAVTPLLQEVLGFAETIPGAVEISESIGPMQAGVLGTALSILGVKPFDHWRELFSQFDGLVPAVHPADYDLRPVSIVLAADGNRWPWPVAEMLDGVSCRCVGVRGADRHGIEVRPQRPLRSALGIDSTSEAGLGWQRVRYALVRPPLPTFDVIVDIPQLGVVQVASAALLARLTELVLILRPDGTVELTQLLLPLPGFPNPPGQSPRAEDGALRYGPLLRLLYVAQEMYRCGDLVAHARRVDARDDLVRHLRALLRGEWVDPLLSCMAYHACRRERDLPADLADLPLIAERLEGSFAELPDARVVAALERGRRGEALERHLAPILAVADEQPPLLLESAQHLAHFAVRNDRGDAAIVERVRRARPGQPWLQALTSVDALATTTRTSNSYELA